MPKMKTHSGASKRFKITKNGHVKRKNAKVNHILTKKSTKMKRNLRGTTIASKQDEKVIRKLLPYA